MQKRSFPIDNYFMYIAERYLDRARVLIDTKAIRQQNLLKDGCHIFDVDDVESYEVEVLVGRKSVKSYSCDCHHFQNHQICSHIGAAIILIAEGRRLEKKKTQNKRKKSAVSSLHVHQLIDHLSERDLKDFVSKYATADTAFSLKLRSQFAHLIEVKNNRFKYLDIIKKYERHTVKEKLNRPKFRKIRNFIADLLALSDDLVVQENFREAYNIILGSIYFLVLRQPTFATYDVIHINLLAHQKLSDILAASIAPQLRNKAFSDFRRLYTENKYVVEDSTLNLYYILFDALVQPESHVVVNDLENALAINRGSDRMGKLSLLRMYVKSNDQRSIKHLILHGNENLDLLVSMLAVLKEHPDEDLILDTCKKLYEAAPGKRHRILAINQLADIGADDHLLHSLYLDCFLLDHDSDALGKLREMPNWRDTRTLITTQLESNDNFSMLAKIYRAENLREELKNTLLESRSLALVLEHANYLYKNEAKWLKRFFLNEMTKHLDQHLGYQSVAYVDAILKSLRKRQLGRLARDIKGDLINRFSERSFFTKALKEV